MRVLLLLSLAVIYVSAGTGKSMGGAGAFQSAAPAELLAADTALSAPLAPLWSMSFTSAPVVAAPSITTTTIAAPAVAMSKSKPFTSVNAPITADSNTLPVIELAPITQTYNVPQTLVSQENIKQPINQPIYQPYLQRYIQQAQPIIQPVVNRVVQPVVHRQLKPFLTSQTVQGPAALAITNPAQYQTFSNQPIMGSELPAAPMLASYQAAPMSTK